MRRAVFWIMAIGLLRDRGTLVMSFILPPAIFLIFAAVFSGTSGDGLILKLALSDQVKSETSTRLVQAIGRSERFRRVGPVTAKPDEVRRLVAAGKADVGLILVGNGVPLDALGRDGPPPLLVVGDPTRRIAVQILKGEIRRIYYAETPEIALRNIVDYVAKTLVPFTPAQAARADAALGKIGQDRAAGGADTRPPSFERLFADEVATVRGANDPIAYYAGAVAVLFLLLGAVQGAATLLEEKESGVLDRIVAGPGGFGVFVDGKCAFIAALGTVQVALIFGIAWAVHGVSLAGSLVPWLVVTVLTAWAAAGLALFLASLCTSRRQVLTLGNFFVLVLSAIGGSMVPRFLMPGWLQDIGWGTPNTWALEAYDAVVRMGRPLEAVWPALSVLFLAGLAGWLGARLAARRFERL